MASLKCILKALLGIFCFLAFLPIVILASVIFSFLVAFLAMLILPPEMVAAFVLVEDKNKVMKEYQKAKVQVVAGQVKRWFKRLDGDEYTSCEVQYEYGGQKYKRWLAVKESDYSDSNICEVQHEYGGQKYERGCTIPKDSPLQVGHHVDVLVLPDYPRSGRLRSEIKLNSGHFQLCLGVLLVLFYSWQIATCAMYWQIAMSLATTRSLDATTDRGNFVANFVFALAFYIAMVPIIIKLGREKRENDFRNLSSLVVFNAHADGSLLTRFRESKVMNILAMMEGKDVTIPKHAGKDVCLVWALKGECSADCEHKAQHVRYSEAMNCSISELLTKCGIPEAQV